MGIRGLREHADQYHISVRPMCHYSQYAWRLCILSSCCVWLINTHIYVCSFGFNNASLTSGGGVTKEGVLGD